MQIDTAASTPTPAGTDTPNSRHEIQRYSGGIAKLVVPNGPDLTLHAVSTYEVTKPGGYATAKAGIAALAKATAGEAPAAALLHANGRFFGYTVYGQPSWLQQMGNDFVGRRSELFPLHATPDTELKFRSSDVVAVVDGDVLITPQA